MKALKLKSPAKVNLYLKILKKRPDSCHNIVTIFERIDLFDEVILSPRFAGIKIICSNPEIPNNSGNLAYKAAAALLDYFKRSKAGVFKTLKYKGVVIRIKKSIPVGAGLGGGSSNAATVLKGLNILWKLKLSQKELMKIGAKIGADVNFFLLNKKFAVGRAKGEIIEPIGLPRRLWHILAVSGRSFLTKEIYGLWDRFSAGEFHLTGITRDVKMILHSIRAKDYFSLGKALHNDLEESARLKDDKILKIKELLLSRNAPGALMSGSGSTVFAIVSSRKEAIRIRRELMPKLRSISPMKPSAHSLKDRWQIFIVKTC